jgi:hypothetical protein
VRHRVSKEVRRKPASRQRRQAATLALAHAASSVSRVPPQSQPRCSCSRPLLSCGAPQRGIPVLWCAVTETGCAHTLRDVSVHTTNSVACPRGNVARASLQRQARLPPLSSMLTIRHCPDRCTATAPQRALRRCGSESVCGTVQLLTIRQKSSIPASRAYQVTLAVTTCGGRSDILGDDPIRAESRYVEMPWQQGRLSKGASCRPSTPS